MARRPGSRMTTHRKAWWLLPLILVTFLNSGCRLFRSGTDAGSDGASPRRNDPLFGGRYIPKTNLPTSERDTAGQPRDPLFTTPASRDRSHSSPSDSASARDPYRDPYRPTIETTNAGLAGGSDPDTRPDHRGPASTTGLGRGPVPLKPQENNSALEATRADLKRYGATLTESFKDGSDYVLRADLPSAEGRGIRRFEGAGPTLSAATRELLNQIRESR